MTNTQNLDAIRKARQFPGFPIRTAVILTAGMGIRLKERGRLMPKGCLRLGEESIIEESISRLLGAGIRRPRQGFPVGVPHDPTAILNTYFGSNDWMELCQLPYRDHRNGGELTGFPDDKFEVQTVLSYLTSERLRAPCEMAKND